MTIPLPLRSRIVDHRRHLLVCVGERCAEDGMTPDQLVVVGQKLIQAGLLRDGPGAGATTA